MARTHGISADRVRAIEVVTGDGEFRRVTPDELPDLFFALRGGKGAAGIVTALEIDLVELADVLRRACFFAGDDIPRVISAWRDWSDRAARSPGRRRSRSSRCRRCRACPSRSPGGMTLSVRFVWTGQPEDGERWFSRIRSPAARVLDTRRCPRRTRRSTSCTPTRSTRCRRTSTRPCSHTFDESTADALLGTAGPDAGSPQVLVEVRQLGGAYAYEGDHPSAFDHRSAAYSLLTVGIAGMPGAEEHASRLVEALAPWDSGRVWPNFAPPTDAASARRATAPRRWPG